LANLAQLKMLEELDGFLLVDKPAGIAFSTVIKTVKRKFNLVKVGHGGSLDAAASGLFILLVNDANRFVGDVMGADREYTGTLRLGATTDTGDSQGRPVDWPNPLPASEMRGDVFLTEPRFCAVRREGTAEYEIADTGEHAPILGHVYRFDLDGESFSMRITKNVLPRAMAQAMGATLTSLRRTRIGKFSVGEAIPFNRLLETEMKDFASCVMPLAKALP